MKLIRPGDVLEDVGKQKRFDMSIWKRIVVVAGLGLLQTLYFPIGRSLRGGVALITPLDAYVPVWPVWVIPYDSIWLMLGLSIAWAVWKLDDARFRALTLAQFAVTGLGMAFWLVFPTYVIRPTLAGQDIFTQLLRLTYAHDVSYNAFPSAHVYLTALPALFWARWYPRTRWLWAAWIVVVILSTLFTGQHYLVDPVGGLALAWLCCRLGLRVAGEPAAGRPRPRLTTSA